MSIITSEKINSKNRSIVDLRNFVNKRITEKSEEHLINKFTGNILLLNMDKERFASEIEQLLHENGAIKELQTQLRSELIQILMNKKQPKVSKDVSDRDKTLNLLIIEHLMSKELWFTCSVMSSEASFIEPPPEIETVITSGKKFRRHNPAKLSTVSIHNILRHMENPNLTTQLGQLEEFYVKNRSKSLLDLCLTKDFEPNQRFLERQKI